jgi:predicted amidohydrolase
MPAMDLVVFPEYSLHGLSLDTNPEIMCRIDGPEVTAFRAACRENTIWGCLSVMEHNPRGNPYNTGIIIGDCGELRLCYRKLHPWMPVEPWEPGDLGIRICDDPNGSRLALIICHDGMFPELARECPTRARTSCSARPATPRRSATQRLSLHVHDRSRRGPPPPALGGRSGSHRRQVHGFPAPTRT